MHNCRSFYLRYEESMHFLTRALCSVKRLRGPCRKKTLTLNFKSSAAADGRMRHTKLLECIGHSAEATLGAAVHQ